MKKRTKQLAILLLAGVVLSSGAYALGSQSGGGGALASGSNASASSGSGATNASDRQGPRTVRGVRRGARDFGLDALAQKLGVSPTALRDALQAIRQAKTPQQRRTEAIQALATALGKPVDQVTSAVTSVLPDRGPGGPGRRFGDDFAAALAKALGVDQAKVQAGLDKARQDLQANRGNGNGNRRDRDRGALRDTLVNDVAAATGADAAKVRSALQGLRPDRGQRRQDRRDNRDDVRQKLATALGVTTAQLDAAFKTVATQARDQFATELAQRLNVDAQKVKDALASLPGPGRRHP
jgi:transcriptional regulator with XRE-family HTH domain